MLHVLCFKYGFLHIISGLFAGLIDYNFHCFRNAIQEVFELKEQAKKKSVKYLEAPPIANGYMNGQTT